MIFTLSAFNYGHTVTASNASINFIEPLQDNIELTANIEQRDYSLSEFVDAVALAMNNVGKLVYTASLDRNGNFITIESTEQFDLLVATGSQSSISAFSLMGFTGGDVSGLSITGDSASGKQYIPQYYLQDYVDFEDDERSNQAKVNVSSSGDIIEVVNFGVQNRMSCLIDFVKDGELGVHLNKTNTGLQELREFLKYIRTKAKIEFIPDKDNPLSNPVTKCIADKIGSSTDATGFVIRENFRTNYFSSGNLVFLKVR
jgi:hypothetical protein